MYLQNLMQRPCSQLQVCLGPARTKGVLSGQCESAAFAVLSAGPLSELAFVMQLMILLSFSWKRGETVMNYGDKRFISCLLPLKNMKQSFWSSSGGWGNYCCYLCHS